MKQVSDIQPLIEALDHLLKSNMRDFAYSQGLNLRQLECLLYLDKCNRYSNTPLGLTEYLRLTKGTVSQTVISLEKKKLIKKIGQVDDKRVVHLHLLSKAKKILRDFEDKSILHRFSKFNVEKNSALEDNLRSLLLHVQLENKFKTFGVCHSCKHFRKNGLGTLHQCGLTEEALSEADSLLLCREHSLSN